MKNIREHTNLINYGLIINELDEVKHDPQNTGIYYVRASDLTRVSILLDQGSLYTDTDTDTDTYASLPKLDLALGFVITKARTANPIENNRLNFESIGYDFIGGMPNNKILALAARISRLDCGAYFLNQDVMGRRSKQPHIHMASTIKLTGTAIMYALDYLIKNNQLPKNDIDSLFVDPSPYMSSYYTKSWLKHLSKFTDEIIHSSQELRESEQASLDNFLKEIDDARDKVFEAKIPVVNTSALKQLGLFSYDEASKLRASENGVMHDLLTY